MAILYTLVFIKFIPQNSIYQNITSFTGIITNIKTSDNNISLIIKNKEKIIGYIYTNSGIDITKYKLGDMVKITCEEIKLSDNTTPNVFNYKRYLNNKNIYHMVSISSISLEKSNISILYKIRNFFINRSYKLKYSFPYINSLILGNNNYIEDNIIDSYRENGISHLFAISGLHISLFTLALSIILKKIKIKENIRYIILILFLIFYMFLTNFSMSIMRAGIFTIFLIMNKIFYFYIKPINLLLLTLAVIIFINPKSIFDIGLQYSFSISAALIIFQNLLKNKNYLISLFYTSVLAFLISFPITIYNFYQINVLSIVYNLFFVPYLSFIILPVTIISYILPFLDKILFFLIRIMEKISLFLSKINFLKLIFIRPSLLVVILYYVIIVFTLYMVMINKKKCIIIIVIIMLIHYFLPYFKNEKYYFMFDIGQGDSTLFVINNTVTLIDTGGSIPLDDYYQSPKAKNIIIPYLKSQGIKKIDNLILTHGDSDHMQDSIYLINNFKVLNIYINQNDINSLENSLLNLRSDAIFLKKGDVLKIDQYDFYSLNFLWNNENDSSIVLFININNYKFLLLGDISKKVEEKLIDEYNLENIYILKVAHHGSNTSSSYNFIKKISPQYALISAGIDNKFNHPSKETLETFNNLNISYFVTSEVGSIKFDMKNNNIIFYK